MIHSSTALGKECGDDEVMAKDLSELGNANVIVAYLGEPSLGVGAELVIAMQQGKIILGVYESRKRISRFMRGLLSSYEKASLYEFGSLAEACGWITDALRAQQDQVESDGKLVSRLTV